jgi:hypothetical protein
MLGLIVLGIGVVAIVELSSNKLRYSVVLKISKPLPLCIL